jgi:hypothetical protein
MKMMAIIGRNDFGLLVELIVGTWVSGVQDITEQPQGNLLKMFT